ncbi:MAG: endonuclease/exonuclease/phosphatase family protein [Rikenellaceae bacterium]
MRFLIKAFGYLVAWVVALFLMFLGYAYIKEYSPEDIEGIPVFGDSEVFGGDTISVLSWNVGYCGLGDDMDFFMDGGESSRTSRGRTLENLRTIKDSLLSWAEGLDFILLQEVDRSSKRGYGVNQYDTLMKYLGSEFKGFYAANFRSFYVPIPVGDAIGDVDGGLVILSRSTPSSAQRISYPSVTSWPQSMFDLKRCMLSVSVPLSDTSQLWVVNTHNSAYDDGGGRTKEISYLRSYLEDKPYSIVAGDWNTVPPSYQLSEAERTDEHFQVQRLEERDLPQGFSVATDLSAHSARYGYEPYNEATTTRTLIDYAIYSPRLRVVSTQYIDLNYKSSDHNPVLFRFVIEK